MKITFEGESIGEVLTQMKNMMTSYGEPVFAQGPQGPEAPGPAKAPVETPPEKTLDPRIVKMQAAKAAKKAAREAEAVAAAAVAPSPSPAPEPEQTDLFEEPEVDPAEVVKIRQKTIEELQQAYANGHHKEVLVLLSRHGNGAKSFRELPPEAFLPIRKAIDNGALT